jgi:hypothetical protein
VQPTPARSGCTGLSGGVRCTRLVRVNSPLSGLDGGVRLKFTGLSGESSATNSSLSRMKKGDMAIIHRTVRWCIRLSGEPMVASANGRPRNLRATRGSSNGQKEAPDCPVCTGQCPVRQRTWSCNGRLCSIWKEITHRTGYSSCPVVHQTVRCATRQKAGIAFQDCLQRLLAALGL